MSEPGGFDYLDSVSKDEGSKPQPTSNLQTKQSGMDPSPAEGGEGFVGGNPNASTVGFDYVTGKKGYSEDRSVSSVGESSFKYGEKDNTGTSDAQIEPSGSDSTDEKASYKHTQYDEGLPQTWRTSFGAGDAGPSGSDEPDKAGLFAGVGDGGGKPDTQSVPSASSGDHELNGMPQTEVTGLGGGGAPHFKHGG